MLLLWNPWLWGALVMAEVATEVVASTTETFSQALHDQRVIGKIEKELRECSDDILKARQVWSREKKNLDDNIWQAQKYSRAQARRKTLFRLTVVEN
jgi:hypothetical protein